jgi:hypothetical protein
MLYIHHLKSISCVQPMVLYVFFILSVLVYFGGALIFDGLENPLIAKLV